jgi:chromosome partitioning protein
MGFYMIAKIIAVVAPKGGTGKSTVTVQLAIQYALFDLKVLVVNSDTYQDSSGDALSNRDDSNITCITIPTKNLLRELKKPELTNNYDVILIDGEASMHEYSRAAIDVCHYFIIPLKPSQFDINSYARYMGSVIEPILSYKDLKGGVFINEYEKKSSSKETLEVLKNFSVPVFENYILRSELIRKASGLGLGIAEYRPNISIIKNFFLFSAELNIAADIKIEKFSVFELKKRSINRKNKIKEVITHARRENYKEENVYSSPSDKANFI